MSVKTPEYILEAVFRKGAKSAPMNGMSAGDQKANGRYGKTEIVTKKTYDAISKNGDTLELSDYGKKMLRRQTINQP